MFVLRMLVGAIAVFSLFAAAPSKLPVGNNFVPVNAVVTVEGQQNVAPPTLTRDDVMVYLENQRMQVTGWAPVQSDQVGLQLWLLIDDGSAASLGNQLGDLRNFVQGLPRTTQIGIGFLQHGMVKVAQPLSADHAQAVQALRLPLGIAGISASPYLALNDLIRKWPSGVQSREILMVSSGIDANYGPGPLDPYLDEAIRAAQRAGVVVNSIYFASAGHLGHSLWEITWGQNNLARLADETGGEFFWQGNSSPVAFAPYLKELDQHFQNQYLLTFQTQGETGFRRLKLTTEVPHASLVAPTHVYVPGGK